MFRLFHFLALFGYLNLLCFEVNSSCFFNSGEVKTNETFVEVLLEEVLNMKHADSDEPVPNIFFDDYRAMSLILGLLPAILIFSWLLVRVKELIKTQDHPFYLSKTLCLPGYYSFLYRYRPF